MNPIRDFFSSHAERDSEAADSPEQRKAKQRGIELLSPQANETILDIGCGGGRELLQFANAGARVIAIDAAPGMVKRAQERFEQARLPADIRCAEAPILFPTDNSVDAIWSSFSLELVAWPHVAMTLREARRVLKPQGRLVLAAMNQTWPDLGGLRPSPAPWIDDLLHNDHDVVDWKTMLSDHGYELADSAREPWGDVTIEIIAATLGANVPKLPSPDSLIEKLGGRAPKDRIVARQRMCLHGEQAVTALTAAVASSTDRLRTAAAKCLAWIGSPSTSEVLIELLDDKNQTVRWIAAEGLIKIGDAEPAIRRLTRPVADTQRLYNSVGQVIRALHRRGHRQLQPLVEAFEQEQAAIAVPVAAQKLLP